MFSNYFESSEISKAKKLLTKGDVAFIDTKRDIVAYVTDFDNGIFYGLDQFDNDVEIDLKDKKNTWKLEEGTVASDVAQSTSTMGSMHRKCTGEPDCKCDKCKEKLSESPVGSIGRTGFADADEHVTDALRAEFKKIVRKLGGKTVARKLLSEMNAGI